MSERARILHRSPWQGVLYVTGGGTLMLSEMLTTPGASATVLEARVPYAAAALDQMLGRTPEQACSDFTARAMAMAAYQRARHLAGATGGSDLPIADAVDRNHSSLLFGLGCTASLATDRRKRGRHRGHVAVQTETATHSAEINFEADRHTEEKQLQELLWQTLAQALGLTLPATAPGASTVASATAEQAWRDLIVGESLACVTASHDGRLVMPGSFNPLHHAHQRMLAIAEEKTGLAGAYELSIANVDKPFLDYAEIGSRLRQFDRPVWLTRLPAFIEKARYFHGPHFVVGIDTLTRIVDPRYYGGTPARDAALADLAELGTRFVVFGRATGDRFLCLSDLSLPGSFSDQCIEVPADEFAEPVSSTDLRRKGPPA